MNEIQQKLLEIANEYIDICEKLNLRYFAIGGTCLGAARHSGFVPWDDDIDFGMPRKDYDKFQKCAQELLPKHLFLQNHETDHEYYQKYSKIRNSLTTAIEFGDADLKINHGLWIDIFPLDGIPNEKKIRKFKFKEMKILRRRFLPYKYKYKSLKCRLANIGVKLLYPNKECAYKKSVIMCKNYDFETSKFIWRNNDFIIGIKKEWFSDFKYLSFENLRVKVPYNYEDYLTFIFKDWKSLPDESKRINPHKLKKVDLTRSYKDYIK